MTPLLTRSRFLVVGAVACLVAGLTAGLAAAAAPGAGTWTTITTPRAGTAVMSHVGHEGSWSIKGKASSDVTAVNVYCLTGSGSGVHATTVATSVPVTAGAFTTNVPVPGSPPTPQCRLRALPSGVNPQAAYLASYAGPVVNLDSWESMAPSFLLRASAGSTEVTANDAGSCGITTLLLVADDQTIATGTGGCLLTLASNAAVNGAAVVVDGHDAYPPADDTRYGVTPIATVHATFKALRSGAVRWLDVEPLARCATDVAFPPGPSCSLKDTGVEYRAVATLLTSGQVRLRTEFRSVDGRRHRVRVAFDSVIAAAYDGGLGVRFPGQKAFHEPTSGEKVTHLGRGAGTMLTRGNRRGHEGDPALATGALTWSRTPDRVAFAPSSPTTSFELDYHLTVPKGGAVHLGFADSVGVLTSTAQALAAKGEQDMMPAPLIGSPASGSVVKGTKTKVTGTVDAGANGLPASVTVNGHPAKLKPNRAGSSATFAVTFTESLGKHTITAVAKDRFGNARSASVQVRNK